MAAITAAVVGGAALAGNALDASKQRGAAKSAARTQAEGVRNAQEETRLARENALTSLGSGFGQAQETINPLAQSFQGFQDESNALLGLSGQDQFNQALGRVSNPLVDEQERAFRRNSAALGGVGGNVLSELAEQTRQRTEANIGNRLNQLSQAGSPALNALQQLSQLQAGQGTAEANVNIGQGAELTQLAQNLGTAQAGPAAFRAQQAPIGSAISAGLGAFGSLGGFGGATPPPNPIQPNNFGGIQNPNQFGNIA